jgi:mannosyltransferase
MITKHSDINRNRLALACIVAVAASLDLHNLGSQAFWLDEAISDAIANSHGMAFVELAFERESSMALYYLALHGWLKLLNSSDFNIRLLSTVFAVATVPAFYLLAAKLFDPKIGLVAAILIAVNPLFLSYAQEARSYTMTVFLALLSWSFFIESCRNPKLLNLALYVITTTLAIYSHNLAMLILPAQGAAVLFLQRKTNAALFRIVSALCSTCVLVLPLFAIAFHFYQGGANWIAAGIGPPGLHSLREVAVSFAGAIAPPRIRQRPLEVLFAAGLIMYLERFVTAIRNRSAELGSYALVVSAFAIPIALLMGISQIFPMFIVRYVLICLPFLLLMVAVGWVRYCQRWVAALGLTLLVLLSLWSDQFYYSNPAKPPWREAIQYITDNARYSDKVAFAPAYVRFEFEHNLQRFGSSGKQLTIIYPRWSSTFKVNGKYLGSAALMRTALKGSYPRLWIVESQQTGDSTEQLLNDLKGQYPVVLRKQFRSVSVIFCSVLSPRALMICPKLSTSAFALSEKQPLSAEQVKTICR